jgi:hypothetical protein
LYGVGLRILAYTHERKAEIPKENARFDRYSYCITRHSFLRMQGFGKECLYSLDRRFILWHSQYEAKSLREENCFSSPLEQYPSHFVLRQCSVASGKNS